MVLLIQLYANYQKSISGCRQQVSRARDFFLLAEMLLPKNGHPSARKQRQPLNGKQRSKVMGHAIKYATFVLKSL